MTRGRAEPEFISASFRLGDPKTYTRPWSVNVPFELVPDTELLEYVCEDEGPCMWGANSDLHQGRNKM